MYEVVLGVVGSLIAQTEAEKAEAKRALIEKIYSEMTKKFGEETADKVLDIMFDVLLRMETEQHGRDDDNSNPRCDNRGSILDSNSMEHYTDQANPNEGSARNEGPCREPDK